MFDLNLDIVHIHDSPRYRPGANMVGDGRDLRETSRAQMEDSGTSTSSIIINNSTEEATATPRCENFLNDRQKSIRSELIFDIFRKNTDGRERLVTQELLPERSEPSKINSKRPQLWLGLSCSAEDDNMEETELKIASQKWQNQQQVKKRRGPRSRSSQYRGVTFYRRTGRWESHIWDCGKQVYLGGFDTSHAAARAYDRAAIRFRGVDADINFKLSDYTEEMKQTKNISKEAFVQILRRQNTGFNRSSSKFIAPPQSQNSSGCDDRFRTFVVKDSNQRDSSSCSRIRDIDNMHNLDLSLGVSRTTNNPQLRGNGREPPIQKVNQSTTHSSVQTFHDLPLARQSTTTWPAISELVSTCQGRAKAGITEVADWQKKSQIGQSELSLSKFPLAASGFSSRVSSFAEALPAAEKSYTNNRFCTASSSSSAAPPTGENHFYLYYRT